MAFVTSVLLFSVCLSATAICVLSAGSGSNVLPVDGVINQLPSLTKPNVIGPCAAFNTVNVSASDLAGTYYVTQSTFPYNEATSCCSSLTFGNDAAGLAQIQTNLTIFSIARTNPKTASWTWTTPVLGISIGVDTQDLTASSVLTILAYKKGFGVAAAICPQVTSCGLNCNSYILRIAVKNRNETLANINKNLISQLQGNYVPIDNLVNVGQDNCPFNPAASSAGYLPLTL